MRQTFELHNKVVVYMPAAVNDANRVFIRALCEIAGGASCAFISGEWVHPENKRTLSEPVQQITAWYADCKRGAIEEAVALEVNRMLAAGELAVMVEWHSHGLHARAELHSLQALS